MSNYCQGKEKTYSPRIFNVWLNYAKCHVVKIALSVSLCVKRLRNICSYLGHEIPVGWVRLCILSCSLSPASQTGCPSQIEETWHLFLRQSFWLSCSTFLTSSFSPSESITRPISPVHFLLFELFSYLLPVCHSVLSRLISLLFASLWLSVCPSLYISSYFSLCLFRA